MVYVCVCWVGVAIAERLKPFKVKKFIYTDVASRPELANMIEAEYGGKISEPSQNFQESWSCKVAYK